MEERKNMPQTSSNNSSASKPGIDAEANLFDKNKARFNAKKAPVVEEISKQVRYIK
mgnify:CR=1 FL=1